MTTPLIDTVTRVRVHGPSRHLDVAVPDDLSVAELIVLLVEEMGERGDLRWRLEHPVRGPFRRDETLRSARIADGSDLVLRAVTSHEPGERIDDVAQEMTRGPEVSAGAHLRATLAGASSLVPAVVAGIALAVDISSAPAVLPVAVMSSAAVIRLVRSWASPVPAIALLGLLLTVSPLIAFAVEAVDGRVRPFHAVAIVGVGVTATALVARALHGAASAFVRLLVSGGLVTAGWGGAGVGVTALGGRPAPTLAALVVLAVLAHETAPRIALTTSGLARLDDRCAAGEKIGRSDVSRAAGHARLDASALLLACGSAAAAGGAALSWRGGGGLVLASLVCLVLVLRGRAFAWAAHCAACVTPGVIGLVTAVAAYDRMSRPEFMAAVLAPLAFGIVALVTLPTIGPLAASRWRVWASRVEAAAAVALVPVAAVVAGVVDVVRQLVA